MKQNLGKLTPVDVDLVKDERGRLILMNYREHFGYLVDHDVERKLGLFQSRYLLAVMLGVFIGFYGKWIYGVLFGLVLAGVTEFYYRKRFLPSLQTIESGDLPEKKIGRYVIVAQKGKKSIFILLFASLALSILLIINCYATIVQNGKGVTEINNLLLIIVSVALSVYSAWQALNCFKALDYLKKGGK